MSARKQVTRPNFEVRICMNRIIVGRRLTSMSRIDKSISLIHRSGGIIVSTNETLRPPILNTGLLRRHYGSTGGIPQNG
jgi:hypothetical protein